MEPTKLQMFVAEVQGTADSEYIGLSKQIPLRLQMDLLASVMALNTLMSERQKTARNKVINDLVSIAVEQVVESLDPETLEKFNTISSHYFDELYSSSDSVGLTDD
jgi:hypothetical protein